MTSLCVLYIPWSITFWPGLTPFGPPMWQAEADAELTLSASPTTAVGQKALALAKRRYSTVSSLFQRFPVLIFVDSDSGFETVQG